MIASACLLDKLPWDAAEWHIRHQSCTWSTCVLTKDLPPPYSAYKLVIPAPDEASFNQQRTIPTAEGTSFKRAEVYETVGDGGRQSIEPERYDLIPPVSLIALARVHAEGADKHGEGNWKKIPIHRHIGRALGHLVKYAQGDRSEPHLAHALCRVSMAFALAEELP